MSELRVGPDVPRYSIKQSQGRERDKAMAVWGIVLGFLGIIGSILLVALIAAAAHHTAHYQPGQ